MSAHPTSQATLPALNLWEAALQDLEPEERDTLSKHTRGTKPTDVLQIVEKKGQEAWRNRISFKKKSGEVIFLHDIFAKVARWVKKFVEVGDIAVQYDPTHTALPWAVLRFLLQASINDIQRQAAVLEIVEDVSRAIPLAAIIECLYLACPSTASRSLEAHLTNLYALCWSSLAKSLLYYDQCKMKRVLKSVLDFDSDLSHLSKSIANQWILVERSAALARDERLLSHISKSQSYSERLLQMMDDIRTPVSRIETYVEESHQALDEMNRDRILDSISTIPYHQHQTKVSRNVLPGTGKWLLDHQVMRNWFLSSASEVLWLHGIPGSGKSSLVSIVVEKLIAESTHSPSSHPVYFYCNRNPAEKQRSDPTHILRSLLRQLSMPLCTNTLPSCVVDKFNEEMSLSLDLGATMDLIMDIIATRPITYIVLDALDECNAALRDDLTTTLETILQESRSLVKIFISSRNDADLVCWLRDYPNKEILSADNQLDLASFVDVEVDKRVDGKPRRLLRARKVSDALRDEIKWTLKAQAQGMFRWAELQLQFLCKLVTEGDIRRRLGALPRSLAEIYHDIYQRNMSELRDDDPQYEADAKRVFHLMLSSHKPWDPMDMANMLEPVEDEMHQGPEKVFRVTFHLVTHDKELNVLRFAHLSVREFFETSLFEFTPPRSLEANVEACFDYLEKTRGLGFRPVSYPSESWLPNVLKLATGAISVQLFDRLVELLVRDVRAIESWLDQMMEEQTPLSPDESYIPDLRQLVSDDSTMIFVACALGLEDIVSRIIETNPSSVHARNLLGDSTLVAACLWRRNTNMISLLLRKGVAVNEPVRNEPIYSLFRAAFSRSNRSVTMTRDLLEDDPDPDRCYYASIALLTAVQYKHTQAVELLLKYGANPNLPSGYGNETPLHAACSNSSGPCEIVRKLLEAGASVQNVNAVGNDALRAAAQSGREDFVTTLLTFGADVNALNTQRVLDKECASPLFTAIKYGAKQVARQLLSHGADYVPRNNKEMVIVESLLLSGDAELAKELLFAPNQNLRPSTIIQAARLLGENELITQLKILEERSPDEQDLCKTMDVAAERGLTKVFKRLVDHFYDCSLLCSSACPALAGTARRGQIEMFKTLWTALLRNRTTSNVGDDRVRSELSGSDAFIALLHDLPGSQIRSRFSSLLHDAATGGSTDIVQIILIEGAMPTKIRDEEPDRIPEAVISPPTTSATATDKQHSYTSEIRNNGKWYLNASVKAGQADMVKLLLRLGADVNALGRHRQNALFTAIIERQDPNIIKMLLSAGSDANSQMRHGTPRIGFYYRTALETALRRENIFETTSSTVIEALLEHGADANATDSKGAGILTIAVSKGHMYTTKLLLTYGADVNKSGGLYGSPLIAAVATAGEYRRGTKLIELLLKNGADVNAEHPGEHETAIRAALSQRGHGPFNQQIFRLLVAHNADVSALGRDGTQALYVACASGDCDELRAEYLLSHGADVNASGGEYGNALQAACATGCSSTIVELLIAKGAEVNAKGGMFGNALQAASHAGQPHLVRVLVANGANVHVVDGKYGHALQAAVISSDPIPIMKLLLSHGADINACGGKYGTALQAACRNEFWYKGKPAIGLLLSRGADLNMRGGEYGYALICAVAERPYHLLKDELERVKIFLDGGADINCSHEKYGNALYAACQSGWTSAMELLIRRGISLTQLAGEHEHALFVACQRHCHSNRDDERIRLLLDNGVDVNLRGKRYSCALELAIKAENLDAAKLLIERGADVRVETKNDGSLLDIAIRLSRNATDNVEAWEIDPFSFFPNTIRSPSSEIVELLRANGA